MDLGVVSLKYRNYGFVSNMRKHNELGRWANEKFTDITWEKSNISQLQIENM